VNVTGYCVKCGAKFSDGAKYCPKCGNPVANNGFTDLNEQKKKKISGLSIVSFVLSFTVFFSIIAAVLATIDLAHHKDRKIVLSVIALIIGVALSVVFLFVILPSISSSSDTYYMSYTPPTSSTAKDNSINTNDTEENEGKAEESADGYKSSCKEIPYEDIAREPDAYNGENVAIRCKVRQVIEVDSLSSAYLVYEDAGGISSSWLVYYERGQGEKRILENDYVTVYGVCRGLTTYEGLMGQSVSVPALEAKYIDIQVLYEPEYSSQVVMYKEYSQTYSDRLEYYAVVEVKNTGKSNIYITGEQFNIEDKEGHLLLTDEFSISKCPDIIKPGEIGYIYSNYGIELSETASSDDVVFKPEFNVKSTYSEPVIYDTYDTSVIDGNYGVALTGRLTNNTDEELSYIRIHVIYYDEAGNVLGASGSNITGVPSGSTSAFEISGMMMNDDFTAEDVSEYKVFAYKSFYGE
jgi:hypothetical protein